MRLLRQIIRPNAVRRRLMSAACGVYLLASLLFCSLFVIAESDHGCSGEDCPVCLQLQACVDGARLTGPIPAADNPRVCVEGTFCDRTAAPDFRAPVLTLHVLDVRFNE